MPLLLNLPLLLFLIGLAMPATAELQVQLPRYRLQPSELAVIVNDEDPLSRRIADYYRERRGLEPRQLIHVRLNPERRQLPPKQFERIRRMVMEQLPPGTRALALTWARPYRVGCMSITTAFAAGFDRAWCSQQRCAPTRRNPRYGGNLSAPGAEAILPTMAIAARDFDQARALIDRGLAAEDRWPQGRAYLMITSDKARNVRKVFFPAIRERLAPLIDIEIIEADALRDVRDILFHFTGRAQVDGLDSLGFVPGAVADHLTSAGGQLTDSKQMSALRWLEAGATGSYGTVVEPCNLLGKFPHPGVVMVRYLHGARLVEAYWDSVAMPGEGIFIGDPLASPFGGHRVERTPEGPVLVTHALTPGRYALFLAGSPIGPFRPIGTFGTRLGQTRYPLPDVDGVLRVQPIPGPPR